MTLARRARPIAFPAAVGRVAVGTSALLLAGQLAPAPAAAVVPPSALASAAFVDLGTATTYSVLGGTAVTNTGVSTVLAGDLGLSPSGAIVGFPPGTVNGTVHDKDAAAAAAQADRAEAYADAAGQQSTGTFSGDQAGRTFAAGVHTSAAAFANTGTMTLDANGDSSAVFVFQVGAAFSPAAGSTIELTDGALANNVFWQIEGAVSIGAGAEYVGTVLTPGAITLGDGASLKGRALTSGAVSLTNNQFAEPIDDVTDPVVAIDGGATRHTNDRTPLISGTTDEPEGSTVSVTVDGQTLTSPVDPSGAWGVSAATLSVGAHDVVASVTDASRNTGTANQTLTVDVMAPAVTIDGGPTKSTNDATPSISGTTDAAADSTITVSVSGQTLTATVLAGGTWGVDASTLSEGAHPVLAAVTDAAQNTGTANQTLTMDVTVPVVTIDGGAARSTDDASPWIYGTTGERAGSMVDVTVAGQDLTATVLTGGTWGVSATTLSVGAHDVVASVTDAAQNTGSAEQVLTITGELAARYRPDGAVRHRHGNFVGVRAYDPTVQRVTQSLRGPERKATLLVRVTNRGDATDRMVISGTRRDGEFRVTYLVAGRDVTKAVTAGVNRYRTSPLAPGASVQLVMKVTRSEGSRPGDSRTFRVRAHSSHAPTVRDTVAALLRVTRR